MIYSWDIPHRIRWTEDGGFCDAGEDCPVCGAEQEEEHDCFRCHGLGQTYGPIWDDNDICFECEGAGVI
jgi:hypothetical protein